MYPAMNFGFQFGILVLNWKTSSVEKWPMAGTYDEDLHENPFFKALVEKNKKLFAKAEESRWTVSSFAYPLFCAN